MRYLLTIFCFLFIGKFYSQESEEYKFYKDLYPNSNAVTLNKETKITIKLSSENINIKQEFFEEDLYLDDSASRNSKRSLHFSSFFELENIEASSLIFSDGKYRSVEVTEFKEKDELDNSFYDDSKSLNFIYPNLKKGAKSRLKYSENVKNPRFLSPFYFGDYSPIINNKVILVADKNINLKFKEFHTENLDIDFQKQEKRNDIIYTWEIKNMDKYKYEENAPTYKKYFPHIVPIITSYKSKSNEIELASDVKGLYEWYYSLVENINKEKPSDELVNLVNDLTKDKTNDLEKVKAIYYWTQKNIKYIAYEYALGGFIPRQANDVFKKKYGDCKDNSSILFKMLEIAGLEGNLTWIGTRSIPYSYTEVPTPIVDNHMILSYTYNKITYFLDATGRFIPIEYPTPFIQGKEALIAQGKSEYLIKKVPVIPSTKNAVIDTTFLDIEGEHLKGKSKVEITGYRKLDCFNILESITTRQKEKSFYNKQLQKGTNKFIIKDYKETNKYDYDKNFIVDYSFEINDYATKLGEEIYVNLNLNKELSPFKMDKDRINEIEFEYKNYFNYTTTLNIPQGYKIDYIPENVSVTNNFLKSKISYSFDNKTITYNHIVDLDFITLSLEDQKKLESVRKEIEKAYKEVIILKKIN